MERNRYVSEKFRSHYSKAQYLKLAIDYNQPLLLLKNEPIWPFLN